MQAVRLLPCFKLSCNRELRDSFEQQHEQSSELSCGKILPSVSVYSERWENRLEVDRGGE